VLSLWSAPFGRLLLDNVPMRPGMAALDLGCGVFTTNPVGHMKELYEAFAETLYALELQDHLPALERQEAHRMSASALEALLLAAGFVTVRVIEDSFAMRYVDGAALFAHSLTRIGFLEGWRSVVPPERCDEVMSRLERLLDERARRSGPLSMTVPMLYVECERTRGDRSA
jgi:hypothetical protein